VKVPVTGNKDSQSIVDVSKDSENKKEPIIPNPLERPISGDDSDTAFRICAPEVTIRQGTAFCAAIRRRERFANNPISEFTISSLFKYFTKCSILTFSLKMKCEAAFQPNLQHQGQV
jgi:hypothetical protein